MKQLKAILVTIYMLSWQTDRLGTYQVRSSPRMVFGSLLERLTWKYKTEVGLLVLSFCFPSTEVADNITSWNCNLPLQERMQNVMTQDSHFAFVVVLVLGRHPKPSLSCKKWFQHQSHGNCILKLTEPNKLSLMKPSKLCLLVESLGQ